MFQKEVYLHRHSNYKIGGPAAYFVEPKTSEETVNAIMEWQGISKNLSKEKRGVFVLGHGTNIVFSDKGFSGLVLKPKMAKLERRGNIVIADAGVAMADLLDFAIRHSLGGLEWAGGLPGTLGGAVRGNAGCFGSEIKETVKKVKSLNVKGKKLKVINRANAQCHFGYRDSIFKHNGEIILEVALKLEKADKNKIRKIANDHRKYRQERHPLEYPNVGSIFKNVPLKELMKANKLTEKEVREQFLVKDDPFPMIPTARLISQCGLKGRQSGGAMISDKHANFIVNVENATARDVKNLIALVKKSVFKKFHVKLEEEVIVL